MVTTMTTQLVLLGGLSDYTDLLLRTLLLEKVFNKDELRKSW